MIFGAKIDHFRRENSNCKTFKKKIAFIEFENVKYPKLIVFGLKIQILIENGILVRFGQN